MLYWKKLLRRWKKFARRWKKFARRWELALETARSFAGLILFSWFGVTGLLTGRVQNGDGGAVLRTADPTSFWFFEACYLLLSGVFLLQVVLLVPLALRYSLGKQILERAVRRQRTRAQMQEIEAGRGSEPPRLR